MLKTHKSPTSAQRLAPLRRECELCGKKVVEAPTDEGLIMLDHQPSTLRVGGRHGLFVVDNDGCFHQGSIMPAFYAKPSITIVVGRRPHKDTCTATEAVKGKAKQEKKIRREVVRIVTPAETPAPPGCFFTSYYAQIPKLILNGYEGALVPISHVVIRGIADVHPEMMDRRYAALCPPKNLVDISKTIKWAAYLRIFGAQLGQLSPHDVSEDLRRSTGGDVVLLCYEGPGKDCHRHLVSAWLRSAGIECTEMEFPKKIKIKTTPITTQGVLF